MRQVEFKRFPTGGFDVYITEAALPFDGIGCFTIKQYAPDDYVLSNPNAVRVYETNTASEMLAMLKTVPVSELVEMYAATH